MSTIQDYIYENRTIKKGDAVIVGISYKVGDAFDNGFMITSQSISLIEKLPTISYVFDVDDSNIILTKKKNNKKEIIGILNDTELEPFRFPKGLFKIVVVPKMNDVVFWLYDNQICKKPLQWSNFKSEISSISRFISKIFKNNLRALWLINNECNHLFNSHEPLDILLYYKTIIQSLKLNYNDRYSQYNVIFKKKSFISTLLELNPMWHRLDAVSLYELNKHRVFGEDVYTNEQALEFHKFPKKKLEFEKENSNFAEELLIIQANQEKIKRLNDARFIHKLNQKIIDELELTIFDVKALKNKNQILFIFIDKDNLKRFYIEQFSFIFFVSNEGGIIENDYIIPFNENKHIPFIIQKFEILRNLKFAVNNNYKHFMNKGYF